MAPLDGHHGLAEVEIEQFFALACISTAVASTFVVQIFWRYHIVKRGITLASARVEAARAAYGAKKSERSRRATDIARRKSG